MTLTSTADPTATRPDAHEAFTKLLSERIVILDGAMGTSLQAHELQEADFRGERFADHPSPLKNNSDILSLTQPKLLAAIHREYLDAGADLIETNTFGATAVAQADFGLEHLCYEMNVASGRLAREAVAAFEADHPGERRFVAGSIGPTTKVASMSQDVNDPAARAVTFDELRAAYHEQVRGLIDGGVDLLLPETTMDTLNLKACLFAIDEVLTERALEIPVLASVTFTQAGSERTLSGQTLRAFWASISHARLTAVLINCALGAKEMRPRIEELAALVPLPVGCYPNAGLPNEFGGFDEQPEDTARMVAEFAQEGWLNVAGGCCGTTPAHIKAIAAALRGVSPRAIPPVQPRSTYAGLEPYAIRPDSNFTLIGERTNVAGSRKFLRLIKKNKFEAATEVARQQVEGGANLLDVNMDEALLDGAASMTRFLNQIAAEPDIARIPVMVDSSDFAVLEAGLKCLQGKGVANSISLKDGEADFLAKARIVRRYGAAVVVMGFDEEKQAETAEHKVAIAARAYRLLTEEVGFAPDDIIYDGNVFPVATGIAAHDDNAVHFIEALRELKRRFPRMKTSGGISNVSFSYRGNDVVREAMHAVFLYHAIQAGLDMGIVNAGQLAVYDEIDAELRERVEDVILNRRPDATERLTELADRFQGKGTERVEDLSWREEPLADRLSHALLNGIVKFIDDDVAEALEHYDEPLHIIEGPLMDGMSIVGDLFGAGKMFLPQVVKSARVMQKAVALIEPHMERAANSSRGKVLLATVKGDVHDIGKNIVGVVLACNGFEIVDLGVMVPAEKILREAQAQGVDMIGLSGLITPSLHEMVHVAKEMRRLEFDVPLLIGGATTSVRHTAVKIAPHYDEVLHVLDASRAVEVVATLTDAEGRKQLVAKTATEQAGARETFARQVAATNLLSLSEARSKRVPITWREQDLARPSGLGVRRLPLDLAEVAELIDWTPFFHTWELRGTYPAILEKAGVGPQARELKANADVLLERALSEGWLSGRAVYGLFEAHADGDDIVLPNEGVRFPMLRQQVAKTGSRPQVCLADYVAPQGSGLTDHIGAFVVTAGHGTVEKVAAFRAEHDEYQAILLQALADRLAEAGAEWLHRHARLAWGYEAAGQHSVEDLLRERYRGIRPAPGYPATPDHLIKPRLFDLLDAEAATGVELTEGLAMMPASSVSGLYLAHPEIRYFAVGKVGKDQVADYAERMGVSLADAERWLAPNLAY